MSAYRIICVETEHPHRHITRVGTGSAPGTAKKRWTVSRVRAALADGDRFYTVSPSTMLAADVRPDDCSFSGCTVKTIRSHADAVHDNNLDNLTVCRWRP